MADRRILPAAQAVLIDKAGRATQPFYDFLRRLIDITQLTPEQIAELEALLALIDAGGFLPSTTNVVGGQSIAWDGTLAGGLVTLNLVNDTSLQQGTWYYGSDAAAQKGWHRFYPALAAGAGIQRRNSGLIELGEVDNASDLPPVGNIGEAYWVRGVFFPGEMGLWFWNGAVWELDPNASGIVGFNVANGDYGDITVSGDGATWTIDDDAVTDAKLRDSAALSVIGRSANSAGNPADIVAANAGEILRRYADAVAFGSTLEGTLTWDDNAEARLGIGGDLRLFHDGANSTIRNDTGQLNVHSDAAMAITATTNFSIVAGGMASIGAPSVAALGAWTFSVTPVVPDDSWTYAKLQNVSAASRLLGRGDSGAGDVQEITLGTGLSMSGTTLSSTATVSFPLLAPDGSAGAPSYSFSDDTNTGIYSDAADSLTLTGAGSAIATFRTSTIFLTGTSEVRFPDGTAGTPGINFGADTDTGVARLGTDNLALVAGGTDLVDLLAGVQTPIRFLANVGIQDGAAATPGLTFFNDQNTGMWRAGAASIGLATGGTNRMQIGTALIQTFLPLAVEAAAGAGAAGRLGIGNGSANSATAGGVASLPATVGGYLVWNLNGNTIKVPFYSN